MKKILSLILVLFSTVTFAQEKFSDATLKNFASAYSTIRVESNTMQLNMIAEIEKAGLTNEQFTAIHVKLKDAAQSSSVSDEDKKKYNEALANVQEFEKATQKMFESIIIESGLTVETYQSISKACNNDEALNKKVMEMVDKQ